MTFPFPFMGEAEGATLPCHLKGMEVGSFCCPVLPEPRLPNQLGSEYHFVIVGTCTISPITAEPYRAKGQPLHVRRSCFAPTETHSQEWACGGGAGYRPRVRAAYYEAVYRHSRLTGLFNISSGG